MDELFHELNLYLDSTVAGSMGNSAEQNTAALIASSMNSEYEDDWSITTPNSYRDTHTPLTNSSVSSNSVDHNSGFGENVINHQMIQDGSTPSAMKVNGEGGFAEESLPLLTFNEYEEIRNYTDLDLLDVPSPTVLNEINSACQPETIAGIDHEFKTNITPIKNKTKKTPTRKKKKQFPANTNGQIGTHNAQLHPDLNMSSVEVNEEGCFLGFNEESLRLSIPGKKKKKKKEVPGSHEKLRQECNSEHVHPSSILVGLSSVPQPDVIDDSRVNEIPNPAVDIPPVTNPGLPPGKDTAKIRTTSIDSETQVKNNIPHQDVWTAESPMKNGNILKKKFVKKALPQHLANGETPNSTTVKRPLVMKPTRDAVTLESKLTTKAPSYLTLFPMRCKEYPMIYSCNHCVGIFTSVRAGQLHDCVKKRRGRKAGTKLQQSYSRNYSDWSLV